MIKRNDILGINARNLLYIKANNDKSAIVLADNKLLSKKILTKAHLPVPKIYQTFQTKREVMDFDWEKGLPNSFVLKPNRGYGGEGILVVFGKRKDGYVKPNGEVISIEEIRNHTLDILDGNYSLNQIPDSAFIEHKLKVHPKFRKYVYRGIPDIRIIVYNFVPVMAMMRLPTRESEGRANIHQGAIGVGIDIATGITTGATCGNKKITKIPGTKIKLNGIKIPEWDQMLNIASETQRITKIGYLGVDLVLDRNLGPTILEVNARPGLSIQNANLAALRRRLERVEGLEVDSAEKGVRVAKELFGGKLEKDTLTIGGKKILGIIEKVIIIGRNNKRFEVKAKVDTGAWRSGIDRELLSRIGGETKVIREKGVRSALGRETRKIIKLRFILKHQLIKSDVYISNRAHLPWKMLIGRQDIGDFMVNPTKNAPYDQAVRKSQKYQLTDEFSDYQKMKRLEETNSYTHLDKQGQE